MICELLLYHLPLSLELEASFWSSLTLCPRPWRILLLSCLEPGDNLLEFPESPPSNSSVQLSRWTIAWSITVCKNDKKKKTENWQFFISAFLKTKLKAEVSANKRVVAVSKQSFLEGSNPWPSMNFYQLSMLILTILKTASIKMILVNMELRDQL